YNSLIVKRPLNDDLMEIARSDDGAIMGLKRRDRPQWGIQFHPESILTEHGRQLAENFRDITSGRIGQRRSTTSKKSSFSPAPKREEISIRYRKIGIGQTAVDMFLALARRSKACAWLDSADRNHENSRWSYFAAVDFPGNSFLKYSTHVQRVEEISNDASTPRHTSVLDYLARTSGVEIIGSAPPCPFAGGHIGWIGYEMRNECGAPTDRRAVTPDALFLRANSFLAFDHAAGDLFAAGVSPAISKASFMAWVNVLETEFSGAAEENNNLNDWVKSTDAKFQLRDEKAVYEQKIERCLELIRDGETYQVCLTNEISCQSDIDHVDLYECVRRENPAPFSALVRWEGNAVISASPERFLSIGQHQKISAKPIKGTIRRSNNKDEDAALAQRLSNSSKDRAENVMIVDLLRNDLSKVCKTGTINVSKLCEIESFATVHQLVSTIEGDLRSDVSIADIVRATFPGGSMTGAPKLRTMQHIDALEDRARGVYSGALGWIGYDGRADLSIVIRTIVAMGENLSIGAGGGIVGDSIPSAEFAEMTLKARALKRAIADHQSSND
ncbi:MAG: aminodeoxychorismate synthase component I, partial [Marinicaulis sp.]|nr:aminodeoxychorismate synthase component I [Marinicaulis sp.]